MKRCHVRGHVMRISVRMSVLQIVVVACFALVHTQVPPFTEECVAGRYPPHASTDVPWRQVNLDLQPEDRWTALVTEKKHEIRHLIQTFKDVILTFGNETQVLIDLVDRYGSTIVESLPYPFGLELQGIAKASGIPLGEVVLYNVFYEVFTVCTSIVAEDTQGRLYHGRNLDFGLFMGWDAKNHTWYITEALRPAIVNVELIKKGDVIARTVMYAGYVGVLTGMKPGLFSLTINERFNVDGGYIGLLKWILGDRKSKWMGFFSRELLENSTSYSDAKQRIATVPLIAPAYYILGGVHSGEGCVITRSREKAIDIWNMRDTNQSWYILETNYDHWNAPLAFDDRRTPANNCMMKKTQKDVSFEGIYNVLSSKPVLNKLTTYTALMHVTNGTMETYLQSCPDPCWPW